MTLKVTDKSVLRRAAEQASELAANLPTVAQAKEQVGVRSAESEYYASKSAPLRFLLDGAREGKSPEETRGRLQVLTFHALDAISDQLSVRSAAPHLSSVARAMSDKGVDVLGLIDGAARAFEPATVADVVGRKLGLDRGAAMELAGAIAGTGVAISEAKKTDALMQDRTYSAQLKLAARELADAVLDGAHDGFDIDDLRALEQFALELPPDPRALRGVEVPSDDPALKLLEGMRALTKSLRAELVAQLPKPSE